MPCRQRTSHGRVVGEGKCGTLLHLCGKATQLQGGAVEFSVQACSPQVGFFIGQSHQAFALALQRICQSTKQAGAFGDADAPYVAKAACAARTAASTWVAVLSVNALIYSLFMW